jgi:hypothetical protein
MRKTYVLFLITFIAFFLAKAPVAITAWHETNNSVGTTLLISSNTNNLNKIDRATLLHYSPQWALPGAIGGSPAKD